MKRRFDMPDPDETIDQVRTWAWLVGNLPTDNEISDDQVFGLYSIGYMIAHNVENAIHELQDEIHALRNESEKAAKSEA